MRYDTRLRRTASRPRPWLELLEERGAPSGLLSDGFLNTPLGEPLPWLYDGTPVQVAALPAAANEDAEAGGAWDQGFLLAAFDAGAAGSRASSQTEPPLFGPPEGPAAGLVRGTASSRATIVVFHAREDGDGWWTFDGVVDDESPRGLIVRFGGLPSLEGQVAEVADDGTFSVQIQLQRTPVCEEGRVTAQTTDWHGNPSNVAEAYVRQTNCP